MALINPNGVVAIIPARSGSKAVPNKNIHSFGGHPILAYSIAAARLSDVIERVFVSTDSEEYASLAVAYGAEAPFLRPQEISTDTSTDREYMLHALEWLGDHEGIIPEFWVQLRPTTPLRDPRLVAEAVRQIFSRGDVTSLRSGHLAPETPFKWFKRDPAGFFRGLLPDDPRPEYYNLPRQAFDPVYIPDGYVDVLRASHVLHSESLHGDRMLGFVSPSCIEIDTMDELELLAFQLEKEGSPLLDYLNGLGQ